MDVNEARQITTSAKERLTREQSEALEEQQRLEEARNEEIRVEIAAVRELVDAKIIEAAQNGRSRATYNHNVRISASFNKAEEVAAIKAQASEVIDGVVLLLAEEGFSLVRGEPIDERDIRSNVGAPPEYHVIPVTVSWPLS